MNIEDIEKIEKIAKILRENGISDLEFEQGDVKVRMSRNHPQGVATSMQVPEVSLQPVVALSGVVTELAESSAARVADGLTKVESPIVGTFYRRPAPDREPFVKEGDVVKKGDVLCLVEAMKLMNEIEAQVSGRIERILPQDGEVVEFGEPLFLINPNI